VIARTPKAKTESRYSPVAIAVAVAIEIVVLQLNY